MWSAWLWLPWARKWLEASKHQNCHSQDSWTMSRCWRYCCAPVLVAACEYQKFDTLTLDLSNMSKCHYVVIATLFWSDMLWHQWHFWHVSRN
jgi:hypothetical protein